MHIIALHTFYFQLVEDFNFTLSLKWKCACKAKLRGDRAKTGKKGSKREENGVSASGPLINLYTSFTTNDFCPGNDSANFFGIDE